MTRYIERSGPAPTSLPRLRAARDRFADFQSIKPLRRKMFEAGQCETWPTFFQSRGVMCTQCAKRDSGRNSPASS